MKECLKVIPYLFSETIKTYQKQSPRLRRMLNRMIFALLITFTLILIAGGFVTDVQNVISKFVLHTAAILLNTLSSDGYYVIQSIDANTHFSSIHLYNIYNESVFCLTDSSWYLLPLIFFLVTFFAINHQLSATIKYVFVGLMSFIVIHVLNICLVAQASNIAASGTSFGVNFILIVVYFIAALIYLVKNKSAKAVQKTFDWQSEWLYKILLLK